MRNLLTMSIVCGLVFLGSQASWAQHEHGDHDEAAPATYGHITFPTSCAAAVRHEFELGVAEMHSFEYSAAYKQFGAVTEHDPECAIAYWGEAMTLFHQLWAPPQKDAMAEGWQLVQKAQAAKEKNAREEGFVAAAAAYYKPGDQSSEERATAYSLAMGKLHDAYPEDEEAAIFYALSLLSAEPPSDTSLSYHKKAVVILNGLLAKDPDHPGLTHYIIHACDNPQMAQEGLAAARHYANIAPGSPHAVHMPSHIFARLGLWQESIHSNLAAIEVSKTTNSGTEYELHPMDFLMYAYLQTGQDDKARAVEEEAVTMKNEGYGRGRENYYFYVQAHFPAMLALETRDWKSAVALQPAAGAGPGFREITFGARAEGAGHLKDVAAAKQAVHDLEAADDEYRKAHPHDTHPPVDTDVNEAKAWLAYAQGNNDAAFGLLKPVIELQDKVGKGEVELPAREMYADMLLELNRPQEALQQYQLSLKTDPNRFNAVYGAAHSAELAQQRDLAITYYKQLLDNCKDAKTPRPELAHAKDVVAQVVTAKE